MGRLSAPGLEPGHAVTVGMQQAAVHIHVGERALDYGCSNSGKPPLLKIWPATRGLLDKTTSATHTVRWVMRGPD